MFKLLEFMFETAWIYVRDSPNLCLKLPEFIFETARIYVRNCSNICLKPFEFIQNYSKLFEYLPIPSNPFLKTGQHCTTKQHMLVPNQTQRDSVPIDMPLSRQSTARSMNWIVQAITSKKTPNQTDSNRRLLRFIDICSGDFFSLAFASIVSISIIVFYSMPSSSPLSMLVHSMHLFVFALSMTFDSFCWGLINVECGRLYFDAFLASHHIASKGNVSRINWIVSRNVPRNEVMIARNASFTKKQTVTIQTTHLPWQSIRSPLPPASITINSVVFVLTQNFSSFRKCLTKQ